MRNIMWTGREKYSYQAGLFGHQTVMLPKRPLVSPVVKWVGGKRQLIPHLAALLPEKIDAYCEPFVGGGALLFYIQPAEAYINDINKDLILVYTVIKDNIEELIQELATYENSPDFFYTIRALDRNKEIYSSLSDIARAARILYLNKTCYNGLYRVNNSGEFNSPFGRYKNPNIVNASGLRAVHRYFNSANIRMTSLDYVESLKTIPINTFVYLDPPYDPVSTTASFTGYTKMGFTKDDQKRLKQTCDWLDSRGIQFMLSNSATNFIEELYTGYNVVRVQARRLVNSVAIKRGNVDELIVRNYE